MTESVFLDKAFKLLWLVEPRGKFLVLTKLYFNLELDKIGCSDNLFVLVLGNMSFGESYLLYVLKIIVELLFTSIGFSSI